MSIEKPVDATQPRVFVAGMATEVNTFSPIFIGMEDFKASMYCAPGEHDNIPTLCTSPLIHARARAKKGEIVLIEGTVCFAEPGGLINKQTYEDIRDEILDQLKATLPVDGVALCLHGAMVAQGYIDPEGDLIENVRALVGPDVPISAGFDPHSHLTAKRVEHSDILVAFKEFPHTDFVERGREVVDLLMDVVNKKTNPLSSVFDCKMIDVFPTNVEPMRSFVEKMFALEKEEGILSISLVHGFMAGDVPEMGTKVLVITDGDKLKGDKLAKRLGQEVFAMRGKNLPEMLSPEEAIARANEETGGPVVIADFWDNPGGGVAGDATILLQALMDNNVKDAALATIWDPIAVRLCMVAGVGAEIPLRFGAKSAPYCGDPIDGYVKVKSITKDAFQTFGGSRVPLGDTVLIEIAGIDVILNSHRSQAFERSVFTSVGVDPTKKNILVVKSTNHFHADFSQFASLILYCEAGKPYPSDPNTTIYLHAPRNIWPMMENPHE